MEVLVEIQRVIKGGIDLERIDALAAGVDKSPQSICTDDRSSSFNSIGKVSYCYVESSVWRLRCRIKEDWSPMDTTSQLRLVAQEADQRSR